MTENLLWLHIFMFLLFLLVGIKEVVPRKLEVGEKTVHFHGNRWIGAVYFILAFLFIGRAVTAMGWVHLPGLVPS